MIEAELVLGGLEAVLDRPAMPFDLDQHGDPGPGRAPGREEGKLTIGDRAADQQHVHQPPEIAAWQPVSEPLQRPPPGDRFAAEQCTVAATARQHLLRLAPGVDRVAGEPVVQALADRVVQVRLAQPAEGIIRLFALAVAVLAFATAKALPARIALAAGLVGLILYSYEPSAVAVLLAALALVRSRRQSIRASA